VEPGRTSVVAVATSRTGRTERCWPTVVACPSRSPRPRRRCRRGPGPTRRHGWCLIGWQLPSASGGAAAATSLNDEAGWTPVTSTSFYLRQQNTARLSYDSIRQTLDHVLPESERSTETSTTFKGLVSLMHTPYRSPGRCWFPFLRPHGGYTRVCDTWQVRCQTHGYLPSRTAVPSIPSSL